MRSAARWLTASSDGSGGADRGEGDADTRGAAHVLQPGEERLPRVPGEGDVAAAERDGDVVETLGHGGEVT